MSNKAVDVSEKTGEGRVLTRIEMRIKIVVDDYINYRNNYFVDTRRFQAIESGHGRDLTFSDGNMTRYGGCVARWTHWSLIVSKWTTNNG